MRLYLSSYKWGNHPERLHELVGLGPKRVALILNAKDAYDETVKRDATQLEMSMLASWGYDTEHLDLRDYFGKESELEEELSTYDLIWVFGGNAFVLRRAMKYSGFDTAIRKLLVDDSIVYGGFSAGPCVLAPTLKGIELCDDPSQIPDGYDDEIIWDGLDIVPFSVAPHYKSDHHESARIDQVVAYFEEHAMPYEPLRDGEVIIIDGDRSEKIT